MDQSARRATTLPFQSLQPELSLRPGLLPRRTVTLRISRQHIGYSFSMEFAMLVLSSDKTQEVSIAIWSSHELQNPLLGHARSCLSERLWRWEVLLPPGPFWCCFLSRLPLPPLWVELGSLPYRASMYTAPRLILVA